MAKNASPLSQPGQWDPAYMNPTKMDGVLSAVGGLWDCCERLLTSQQPVAAALPSTSMLMLLIRVLSFSDSSIPQGLSPHS